MKSKRISPFLFAVFLFLSIGGIVSAQTAKINSSSGGNTGSFCPGESTSIVFSISGISSGQFEYKYTNNNIPPDTFTFNTTNNTDSVLMSTQGVYELISSIDTSGTIAINPGNSTVTLTELPKPVVNITPDPAYANINSNLNLSANVSNGTSPFSHSWGGSVSGMTSSVTFFTNIAGSYSVSDTVTDANSCSATDNLTVTVTNLTATISTTPPSGIICEGETINLDGKPNGGSDPANYTHSWTYSSAGGGTGSFSNNTIEDPTFTPTSDDTYTLTYAVTDTKTGATATASTIVTANPLPDTKTLTATNYCAGASGGKIVLASSDLGFNYTLKINPSGITITTLSGTGGDLTWTNLSADNYYITATNTSTSCTFDFGTVTVIENALPTLTPSADKSSICSGSTTTLRANASSSTSYISGYQWSDGSTNLNTSVSPATSTPYSVTVTDGNGCKNSAAININVIALPTINMSDDQSNKFTICENNSITLTATSTKTINSWAWSNGSSSSSATVSPTTNTTYTLTVTDTDGCSQSASQAVTVNDQPTANAGSDEKICYGAAANLTASAKDGSAPYSYAWNTGDGSQGIIVTPSSSGTYTVTVTDNNGCSHSDDVKVTVVTNPTVNADVVTGYNTSICDGDSTKLSATASGGKTPYSYNWLPGGLSNSSITVSPRNATYNAPDSMQTYTVYVTDGNGCKATDNIDITIFSLNSLIINNNGEVYCKDEGNVTLTGNPSNGSSNWSSPSPTFLNGPNTFNTTTNTQGTYSITYGYTNSNGCASSTTGSVTILPYNTPNITDIDIQDGNEYCHTDIGSYTITGVLTPDISGESGVVEDFSGTGVSEISPGNFVFSPSIAGQGNHTITYSVTTPGCNSTYTETVSVGLPVTITAPTDMCIGDADQSLTADVTTGAWTIKFTDTNGIVSSIGPINYGDPNAVLKASKPGTYSISYELTSGAISCTNTSTVTCVVHPLPNLAFDIDTFSHDDLNINFCTNNSSASLIGYNNGTLAGGGTFSGTGVSASYFDPTTGPGNYTITYTYTDPNGCSSSVTSNNIEVNEAPTVDIAGLDTSYCSDDAIFTISGNPKMGNMGAGAFTFPASWTSGVQYTDHGDGTAEINPANIGTYGTYSITYSLNDINGCTGTTTETFTIHSIPSVDITGIPVTGTVCKKTSPITITGSPTNSNGWFSSISGLTDNGDGTATFYPDSATAGNHTITYNYTNPTIGCSNSVAKNIEILPIPNEYTIVAPSGYEYCEGDTGVILGVSNSQNTYIYDLVRDGSTTVSTVTSSANGAFNFVDPYTNGDYTVRAIHPVSGCSVTFNNVITVAEVPAIDDAGNISGSTSICADGTSTYTYIIPAITNATDYVWTLPANVSLNYDGGDTISVTYNAAFVSGSIEVYGTNPGYTACPDGGSSSISVKARVLPSINGTPAISGDGVVCQGETGKTYSINATDFDNETSYEWQTTVGTITSNPSASSVNVSFLTGGVNGTIRVRGVNACGTSAWINFPVTVNGTPNVSINSLTASDIITCSSTSQVQLNAASTENAANITGWSWSAGNGGIIVAGDETSQNPFVSHEGDYIVQIEVTTNGQACYNTDTVTVGANRTKPSLSIDSPDVLTCSDTTVSLKANATNVDYSWSFTHPANIVGTTNTDAPVVNKPGTYTVVVTDLSNYCTSSASVTVTQDTVAPNISVTNPATDKLTCTVSSVNIFGNSTTAGATYEWTTAVSGATITNSNNSWTPVDKAGLYTLEVTNPSNGCTSSRNVTVNESTTVPTITALTNNNGALTCNTTTVELEAEVASVSNATFTWSTSGGTIVSTYGTYNQFASVSAAGIYTVEATHPESGCIDTETITVSSNYAIPTINIVSDANVITCSRPTIKLDASSSTNVGSFTWTASLGGYIQSGGSTNTATIDRAGRYTLIATHSITGCKDTSNVTITENTAKPADPIPGTSYTLTCKDTELKLSATVDPGTSIKWTGPGVIADSTTTSPTINVAGTYTITTTASNGCSSSDDVDVYEDKAIPDISVIKNPGNITCDSTTIDISGSSSTPNVTYDWKVISGSAVLTNATTQTATVNGNGQFRLTVTAPNGCTNSDIVTVGIDTVTPILTLPAVESEILTCSNTSVELDGESTTPGVQFFWSTTIPGATISNSALPKPEVDKAGTYTVVLTNLANGCTATKSTIVSSNYAIPTINIVSDANVITCSRPTIKLDASSSTNVGSFTWTASAGGNIQSGGSINTATIDQAGTYTLIATHSITGCQNTSNVTITKDIVAPLVNITGTPYTLTCNDPSLELTATASTGTSISWTGPNTSTIKDPNTLTPEVNMVGKYTITVKSLANGCTSSADVDVYEDKNVPDISVNKNPGNITCDSTTIDISGSSSTPNVTYDWKVISGSAVLTNATTQTATVNGNGQFRLTVTAPNGCANSDIVTVGIDTVTPILTLPAVESEILTCSNTSVELDGESTTPGVQFFWSTTIPGATISNSALPKPKVDKAGIYTVVLTNPTNGCSATKSTIVSSNYAKPTINIVSDANVITCSRPTIKLDASSSTNVGSFAWTASSGGNIQSGGFTNTATIDRAGRYTLIATHSITGCKDTSNVTITENTAKPAAPIPGTSYTLTCKDTELKLSATVDPGTSIKWTGPGVVADSTTTSPTINVAGTYTITTTATNGCTSSADVDVYEDKNVPDISVIKNPGNITCDSTTIDIRGSSSTPNVTYDWKVISGNAVLTNATTHTATVNGNGQFRLTVTAPNGCTNSDIVTVGIDTVTPNLTLPAVESEILTCSNTLVELDGESTTPGVQFFWSTTVPGATISNIASPKPKVDKAGAYTVVVTNPTNGCTATKSTSVSSNYAIPTINIVPDANVITCSQPTIILNASSSTNATSFAWTASASGNIVSGSSTNTATISQAGTYTVTASHPTTGCQAYGNVTITADTAKPAVPIIGSSYTLTCKDTELKLSATVDPGTSIKWTGPGVVADSTTTSPTINLEGTYYITTTAANGCSSSANVMVNKDKNVPNITVNKNPGNITCAKTSMDIEGYSPVTGVTYDWKVISGSASLTNATTSKASVNGDGQFRLTVTAPNGCTNSDIVSVGIDTVSPTLFLPAVDGDLLTCDSTWIELDGSSSTSGAQFSWSTTVSGATIKYPATATPEVDKTGDYIMVVTDPTNGCKKTGTTTVLSDYSTPTVSITPVTDKITCTNKTIQLNASGSSNAGSYLWTASNGGNITTGATTATPVINAAGRYTVTVKHTITGCTASAFIDILEDSSIPTIDSFDPYPATLTCSNGSVALLADASSLTTNKIIAWSTSDGHFTSATDITNPTVDAPGTYTVSITNTANGCSSVKGVTVKQNITPPSIQINTPDKLTCSVSQVSLKATAASVDGSALSYAWSAGPGGIISSGASTSNPTVTAAADYNLIVTDLGNSCSNSSKVTVAIDTVSPDVTVDLSPKTITCDSVTVQLNGLSTYPNVSYQWNTSGGGTIFNANTETPIVDKAGIYILTVKNLDNNCTATSANVYVNENVSTPSITMFAPSGDITCSVSSVTLNASQNSDYTYSWSGLGTISNTNSYTTNVDAAGAYSLIITDINNGCDTTYSVTVNEDKAVPSTPVISNEEACYGAANPTFTALTGTDVKWYSNPGLTGYLAGGNSYMPTASATGVHSYYATSTGSNGCTSLPKEVTLTIHDLPNNPVTVDASICEGSAGKALNALGNNIQWYTSAGSYLTSGNSYIPTDVATGTYTYLASQTDNNGCESSKEPATYTIKPIPLAPVLVDANLEVCENEITPSFSVSGVNIKWYRNLAGSVISTASSFQPTQTAPGTYTYYVTQSTSGCESPYETATLDIMAAPTEYMVTGGGTYCEGTGGLSVGLSGSQAGITYELWLDEADMIIDMAGTGAPIDFGYQTEEGTYTVHAYNTSTLCGKIMGSDVKITMKPLPGDAPAITGYDEVCQKSSGLTYSVAPIPNATKYVWSLPSGFNIISGDNSESITVETDNTASDGIITVYAENNCGTGSVSPNFYVKVNEVPDDAVTINGPGNVCSNETGVTYSVDAIHGAISYVWSLPAGATIISGHNTRQIVVDFSVLSVSDDISVYGKNNCGTGASVSKMINVNTPPKAKAGDDQQICSDQTIMAATGLSAGESGSWTLYDGAASFSNTAQSDANVTGIAKGNNIFVWSVTDANGCTSSDTVIISNNLVPIDAGDDLIICSNTINLQAVTPTTGGHWELVKGSASIVDNYSPNTELLYLGKGANTFAWVFENNSCRSSDTVSITNNVPETPKAGDDQIIESVQTYLDAESPKSDESGMWRIYNGGGNIIDKTDAKSQVTELVSGDNVFVWTVTKGSCSLSDTVIITNTLDEEPEAGIEQTICANTTLLNATEPDIGKGEWSVKVNHGSATFEDVNDPKTRVTNLGLGENWLIWTVSTSSHSSRYDSVLITNNQVTEANAGADRTLCIDTALLSANKPIYGSGKWTISGGSGSFNDDTNPAATIKDLSSGENVLKWTIINKTCSSEASVTIINNMPTEAKAGDDQTICNDSTVLLPNTPTVGKASWSVISGTGTFVGNTVTQLAPDTNIFLYTITQGSCDSYDLVNIINNKPSTPTAGYDKSLCIDTITLQANQPAEGNATWSIINGSGTFADKTDPNSAVRKLAGGLNIFRWTISKSGCVEHDEVKIYNNSVTAVAGDDITLCEDEYELIADNNTIGTGTWSIVGASGANFEDKNAPNTMVTNLSNGPNQLRWTVKKENCVAHDDIIVTSNKPTDASAGVDDAVCSKEVTLNANSPKYGNGAWILMDGSGTFSDETDPGATLTNLSVGKNLLRWTITQGECTSYDDITITSNLPVNVFAGSDQVSCSDTAGLGANKATIGIGQWSIIKGSGSFVDANYHESTVRNLAKGENIFKWTVSSTDCSISDTVVITSTVPTSSYAGPDRILCTDSYTLSGNTPKVGTGEWMLISGSASFASPNSPISDVSGLAHGKNVLRWTISKNGCYSYDEIVLTNNLPSIPFAGYDETLCIDSTKLYAAPPEIGTGNWSLVSGDAVIVEPNSNQTLVTNIDLGDNTFRWTITNKNCKLSDEIVITSNYELADAGLDETIHIPSVQLIGNNPSTGKGEWKLSSGAGNIATPNSVETMVTDLSSGANVFTWSITNGDCTTSDDVSVNYIESPILGFEPSSLRGCPPVNIKFVNKTVGGTTYEWDFGDGAASTENSPSHTYTEAGKFTVKLTAYASLGTSNSMDTVITIYPKPTAYFEVAPDTVYIPDDHISCYNYSEGADSSIWYFGDGNSLTGYAPTYTYTEEGSYNIGLKVISEDGCTDSLITYNAVNVKKRNDFFFPEAFTPNLGGSTGGSYNMNDRSNDVFFPIMVDGEVQKFEMKIYSRLGVMVFSTKDVNVGWDGYYKGKLLPQDIYIYIVTGKYNSGKSFQRTGNVLLLLNEK